MKKSFLFLLCISAPFIIAAQHNSNIEKKILMSSAILVIKMMLYYGRFDSITHLTFFPSIGHYDAFFADASLSYLMKSSENRIDLFY
jgi:hypothetical protein